MKIRIQKHLLVLGLAGIAALGATSCSASADTALGSERILESVPSTAPATSSSTNAPLPTSEAPQDTPESLPHADEQGATQTDSTSEQTDKDVSDSSAADGAATDTLGSPESMIAAGESLAGNCLLGSWSLSASEAEEYYLSLAQFDIGEDVDFTFGGSISLDFSEDGTLTYTPDLHLEIIGYDLPAEASISGTTTGPFSVKGGVLRSNVDADKLNVSILLDGLDISDSGFLPDVPLHLPLTDVSYTCGSTGPVLKLASIDSEHVVHLQPS